MPHLVDNDILLPEIGRLLSEGREVRFTPTGVSMRPWIEGGTDSVVLHRVDTHIRAGQIVLCKVGSRFVLHRLWQVHPDGTLTLRGDGNLTGEEHCRREDVMGRVVAIYDDRGRRKCLIESTCWLQLPFILRKYGLKFYRKIILPLRARKNA